MLLFYNIGIWFYKLGIILASPFNKKAKLWLVGRKNLFRKLKLAMEGKENVIWFHASSLGEFEQGRPLIEGTREMYPAKTILLTFFSPSGYEVRKSYPGADHVCYLPLDTKQNARRFLSIVKPEKVFFIKYDFWFHFLHEASDRGCPLYLVSALFRKEQVFFRSTGKWYRNMLGFFNHLFVQDEESKENLASVGFEQQVTIAGDTRFDRVNQVAQSIKPVRLVETFKGDNVLVIAGSTWEKDEDLLIKYVVSGGARCKLIIAPHEVNESKLDQIAGQCKGCLVRYSEASLENVSKFNILLIDNVGMLSSLYYYGDIAYVGGGFGKGIHNILEPAVFGQPVIFGPRHEKFREARQLLEMKGAFTFVGYSDLKILLDQLINDKKTRSEAAKNSEDFVKNHLGATQMIMRKCF